MKTLWNLIIEGVNGMKKKSAELKNIAKYGFIVSYTMGFITIIELIKFNDDEHFLFGLLMFFIGHQFHKLMKDKE